MRIGDATWQVNEALWDRVVRILIGIPVLALVFVGPKTAWGYLGLIPLVSGMMGHCVVYKVLGIRTCKAPKTMKQAHHV